MLVTRERRRTATRWFRAVRLARDFQRGDRAIHAVGRKVEPRSSEMLLTVARSPARATDQRWCFTLDDTPTARYGPHVEGAGIHHNPTPGPAAHDFLYGHVWVTLGCLVQHPEHGAISLPVRAALDVREADVPRLPKDDRWEFRTKLQHATDLYDWLGTWLKHKGKPLWLMAHEPVGVHARGVVGVGAKRRAISGSERVAVDDEPRRPSHLDRRQALLAETLHAEFQAAQRGRGQTWKMRDLVERLMLLAA